MDKIFQFALKLKLHPIAAFFVVYGGFIALGFVIVANTPEYPIDGEDFTLKTLVGLCLVAVWAFFVIRAGMGKRK